MTNTNQDDNAKRYISRRYYLRKGIMKSCNIIIIGKKFYDQPSDSDVKRYEETRKLATGRGDDYNARCLLDFDYIKNITD